MLQSWNREDFIQASEFMLFQCWETLHFCFYRKMAALQSTFHKLIYQVPTNQRNGYNFSQLTFLEQYTQVFHRRSQTHLLIYINQNHLTLYNRLHQSKYFLVSNLCKECLINANDQGLSLSMQHKSLLYLVKISFHYACRRITPHQL